jgi:hypothetical protein
MDDNFARKIIVQVGSKPLALCIPPDLTDGLNFSKDNSSATYNSEATTLKGSRVSYNVTSKIGGDDKSFEHILILKDIVLEFRTESGRFRGGSNLSVSLSMKDTGPTLLYSNSYQVVGSHYDKLKSNHRSIQGSAADAVNTLLEFSKEENTTLSELVSLMPDVFRPHVAAMCSEADFSLPTFTPPPPADSPAAAVERIIFQMGIRMLADCFAQRTERMKGPCYADAEFRIEAATIKGASVIFAEYPARAAPPTTHSEQEPAPPGSIAGTTRRSLVLDDLELVSLADTDTDTDADGARASLCISRVHGGTGCVSVLYSTGDAEGGGPAEGAAARACGRMREALQAVEAFGQQEGLRLSQLVGALPQPFGRLLRGLCEETGMAPARIALRLGVRPLADCFPPPPEELRFHERAELESEATTPHGSRVRVAEVHRNDLGRRRCRRRARANWRESRDRFGGLCGDAARQHTQPGSAMA